MDIKKQTFFDKCLQNRLFLYARTFLLNLALFSLAYCGAFALKSDWFRNPHTSATFAIFQASILWVLAIKFGVFYVSRQYRSMGYYATMRELRSIVVNSSVAFVIATCGFATAHTFGWIDYRVPLSVFLIDFMLTIGFRGGWRLARRFYVESLLPRFDPLEHEPAFLIGANNRGAHVANAINSQREAPYRVVGFLTVHDYKVRFRVGSLPVVAHVDNLVFIAKQQNVKTILCVAGLLPGKMFREIYERCDKNGIKLEIVPQVEFVPDTKIPVRDVNVDDLLKRDPICLDSERIKRQVTGRRAMVTGAGGSIGSEICRQLMRFEPAELIILGRGENRIFFLERELRALGKSTKITPIIADVSNKERVDGIFAETKPEIVFHAAAHKHVPLMESNVPEAIRNNIYGTKVVADASDRFGAEKFVMVSTDKAVNPTNVMGCSKQMAERYVNALAERSKTKFIVTRFGNVLGSNGSVVPIFTKQIQQGGPITITDFRMTRYFMTIPEAAQLVLEAGAMGKGGEIFVLDMGEPVKIETLARDLIRLSGLPENAIEIREIGLRPGEKLYEELYFETETRIETDQKKIFA
ncbi:MAG: polysaccharide biosynthesis protein, partial [Thermoguttaceae bacterium]|nr:polysaccharide biosynthesis protein [Thermoguttaceae bacterium]